MSTKSKSGATVSTYGAKTKKKNTRKKHRFSKGRERERQVYFKTLIEARVPVDEKKKSAKIPKKNRKESRKQTKQRNATGTNNHIRVVEIKIQKNLKYI